MFRQSTPYGEFEFFYLAKLTRQRIKPLSRWEKPLNESLQRWLRQQGLKVDTIPRKTLIGKEINETIFSTSINYLNLYRRKFYNSLLDRSPHVQRLEGFLFGYPACCVGQFIRQPYIKNNFSRKDQQKLFHWACPDCRSTQELLSYYRPIYTEVWEWYNTEFGVNHRPVRQLTKKLSLAAAVALWLTTIPLLGQTSRDSTHFIPEPNDQDQDGLSYEEEFYLGSNFTTPNTIPGINDNEHWTQYFKAIIDSLPTTPQPNSPYKIEYNAYGLEYCQKCGASVNMGFVRLINPLRNLQVDIPFIGLHFMENGCFSYQGDIHVGRCNIDTLKQILFPFHPAHMLPVVGDSDNDGLTDAEEDSLYFNPNDPDTDSDGVPDGAQVAEQLIRLFPKLKEQADSIHSNISFVWTYGIENCVICGAEFNMGGVGFVNPENGRQFFIHFNGIHALAHGSFAYSGTTNPNQRADAVELYRTMKTHMLHISNDADDDGLNDSEETHFGYNPNVADTDGDGICDGMDLSLNLVSVFDSLPTTPIPNGPYVIHHPTFGHWNCLLCGEPVNMGFMELFNPNIGSDPVIISYYGYHFLKMGSFSHEGRIDAGQWMEGRIDPVQLANYLEYVVLIEPQPGDQTLNSFRLFQNYPNPFNPETTIEYYLPHISQVSLEIFDVVGQRTRSLSKGEKIAGLHQVKWDGRDEAGNDVASGIYVCRLKAGNEIISRKMLLLR